MFRLNEDRIELVKSLYVANVKNRLRELETPDTDLKKRWIWELIQNAKDCSKEAACYIKNPEKLPYKRQNPSVDIKITYDKIKQTVVFMHNGFPFTNRTLDSLMYKNSTKDGEDDNTGRFGTGFMTSHTLSRVVPIDAPFLSFNKDKWEISYISATVYREGSSDKQLKQEFIKMENSKKCYQYDPNNENHKWTKFTYQLTNEIGMESAELGIQSFRDNIMEVLLFCDEINSIQLNNENPISASAVSSNINLTKSLVTQNIFKNIQVIEKTIIYSKQRKFIVATVDDPNKDYSKKYSKDHDIDYIDRKLKYSIAFETDSNHNLVNLNSNKICLFCTFPLIGSEKFQFPFLLNSPHFETFTERNGIILEGQLKKNNILTNTGLNNLIINSSIELFKIVLQWLIQNNYSNFASFSNGLIFDSKTLPQMEPFLMNLREILENSRIIHNSANALAMFKQTAILNFNNVKDTKTFHKLASQFYSNVATFDECNQWQNKTWDKITTLNVETFVDHVDHFGKDFQFNPTTSSSSYRLSHKLFRNGLNSLKSNDFTFLTEFYKFLLQEDSTKSLSIFSKYSIVLNSNNQFTFLHNLKSDSSCSKDLKQIMELCPSWKNKIIHPQINCFQHLITKATTEDVIKEISLNIEKNQDITKFLLSFVRYTLDNNENRMKMYRVAKLFYDVPEEIKLKDVDEKIWLDIDSRLLDQINEILNKEKGKKFTKSLEDLNIFYELYQNFYPKSSNFLVPNINLILIEKNKLGFISDDIEPVILETLGPFIDLTQYAHPSITSVIFRNIYNLNSLIQIISSKDFYYKQGEFLSNHLFAVLSIMPPKNNQRIFSFQTNIHELVKYFFCSDIKLIPTNIINELFWKKANEIFLDGMAENLFYQKNISNLANALKKENVFKYLNLYYEILSIDGNADRQKKAIIPNFKGSFVRAGNLCLSSGISEELFDLYNASQQESDIREKFAHPKVKCNFLSVIDLKQFIKSIIDGLTDDQLVNDTQILQAISKLDYSKTGKSQQNQNEIILQKLYIANIKNRLNEIQNPTQNDKIRWPWELIQNAKDSLYSPSNTTKQNKVEIFIGIKTDPKTNDYTEIIFSHNGPPFTENSFIGLLYKISQEKDKAETTGRFGTGFISTHVLSKVVQIKGNRVEKNGKIQGFSATLYREGIKDPDIINDFKAMQKSQKTNLDPFPLTEFNYKIKTEESRECVKLGLQHLEEHISTALINCPEIKFIVIDFNGNQTKFYLSKPVPKKVSSISYSICDICNDSYIVHRFIVLENKENKINIAVEIDEHNKIVPIKDNMESISIAFPLVGSSLHALPFYINSPKFEPSTERNALILNGKETINGQLTNNGINRLLLKKSIDLYANLITIFNSIHCSNIYELSRGLVLAKEPYYTFDLGWYQENFLKNMKEIFSNNVYVNTESGKAVLLKEAYFPSKKIINDLLPHFIYLSNRYYTNIICLDEAIIWKDKMWDELNVIEIENLIHEVENDKKLFEDPKLEFLNNFLSFIWYIDRNILYDHKLIPDMNNTLHCLSKVIEKFDMKESKTVQGQIIDILESIGIPWRSTHMNYNIKSISLPEDKMIDAESRIIEKIKENNEMCFDIMKFILKDNAFRENMFYFVTELKLRDFSAIVVNDINPLIWEFADNYVINQIVLMISNFSPEQVQTFIQFFAVFLPFYQIYQKDEESLMSTKIFPNAKFVLKKKNELNSKDESFHDYLNPIMIDYFNKDLDDDILHPEINKFIKTENIENLNNILKIINDKISRLEKSEQFIVAEKVICLIPQEKEKLSKQRQLFFLYQALIKEDIEDVGISSYCSEYNWSKSNQIIIKYICSRIQETNTLANFKAQFSISNFDMCFYILNALYSFASDFLDNYKIIPDQKGEFRFKKDLKEDPGIEDDLLECISYFNPDAISKYDFADKRVQVDHLDKIKVFDFYRDLTRMFNEALNQEEIDYNVLEMIKKINHIDDDFYDILKSPTITEDQKTRIKILENAHVQFIENRLRELNNPKNKDFKRWPFELIQNANDSLFSPALSQDESLEKKKVRIEFEFSNDKVIFSHNGLPFTNDSLFALLYQCSEGKRNDPRSTGKFGTGFLSTHILSKIINFSGDVMTQNGLSGFNVTIYRDGKNGSELREGVKKMEESLKKDQKVQNITKFEFILPDEANSKKASEEGLKSLKNNVGPVLVFNPTIESIKIRAKNETLLFYANHEEGNIQTISLVRNTQQPQQVNKYILCKSKPKYNETTTFDISCLLPISNHNEIMRASDEVLFISYPIFDDIRFISPLIINSPNFEPDKERNCIIFKSESVPDESQESLINKFIINKSSSLLKEILNIATEMNCTQFYNISSGLREYSGYEFLQEFFYGKMKSILLSFPVFETSQGMKKVNEVIIPFIENFEDFTDYNKDGNASQQRKEYYIYFYNLISQLSIDSKLMVEYKSCLGWDIQNWKLFPPKVTVDLLISIISRSENVSDLKMNSNESKNQQIIFLKNVIVFIQSLKNFNWIFSENKILIDENGRFTSSKDIFYFNLPAVFLGMLDIVEYDYRKNKIHHEIEDLFDPESKLFDIFDLHKAIEKIKSEIDETNAKYFMKYIIKDDKDKKRMQLFEYTKIFLDDTIESVELPTLSSNTDDLIQMFEKADEIIYYQLIDKIQMLDIQENIEYFVNFFIFLQRNITYEEFISMKIFPNQKYHLCVANELKVDEIHDENIKDVLESSLGIDLKSKLLLNDFSGTVMLNHQRISDISETIIYSPQFSKIHLIDKSIRSRFYSMIFQYSGKTETTDRIMKILNFFLNVEITSTSSTNDKFTNELTNRVIEIGTNEVVEFISRFSKISELASVIENEDKQSNEFFISIFENLSLLYNFTTKGRIFPNQKRELVSLEEVRWLHDQEIEDENMEKLLDFLVQFAKSDEIRKQVLNSTIEVHEPLKRVIKVIDLRYLSKEIIKVVNDEDKRLYLQFFKFIRSSNELKIVFSPILTSQYEDKFDQILEYMIDTEEDKEINYKGEALVYEMLVNSKKYSIVNWASKSDVPTNYSITLDNGKTYFINEKDECFDIYAEGFDGIKYFFEVKSTKANADEKRFSFKFNQDQFGFANDLSDPNCQFILVLVKNVLHSPDVLFFTKQNKMF